MGAGMIRNTQKALQGPAGRGPGRTAPTASGPHEPVLVSYESLRRERLIQRIVGNLRTRDVATLESLICLLGADENPA
jgi:hypothetical protein